MSQAFPQAGDEEKHAGGGDQLGGGRGLLGQRHPRCDQKREISERRQQGVEGAVFPIERRGETPHDEAEDPSALDETREPAEAEQPAQAQGGVAGMVRMIEANSGEARCATVGVMKARSGPRYFSLNTLASIDDATNIRPTSVADAVPTRR